MYRIFTYTYTIFLIIRVVWGVNVGMKSGRHSWTTSRLILKDGPPDEITSADFGAEKSDAL